MFHLSDRGRAGNSSRVPLEEISVDRIPFCGVPFDRIQSGDVLFDEVSLRIERPKLQPLGAFEPSQDESMKDVVLAQDPFRSLK